MSDEGRGTTAEQLFREESDRLERYLFRLVADRDVAQDLAQEVFARLLQWPPGDRRNLKAWLFTTATNLVRDRARHRRRAAEAVASHPERLHPTALGSDPLQSAERASLRARLHDALAALSDRERVAILMREEGFTHREIADALGTTTGTIGTLLARALTKLARRLPLDRADR